MAVHSFNLMVCASRFVQQQQLYAYTLKQTHVCLLLNTPLISMVATTFFWFGAPLLQMTGVLLFANAPVICIPGSLGAGDSGDIAGLKCLALTSDVSRQCRGFAGVMISRQYTVTLIQIRF